MPDASLGLFAFLMCIATTWLALAKPSTRICLVVSLIGLVFAINAYSPYLLATSLGLCCVAFIVFFLRIADKSIAYQRAAILSGTLGPMLWVTAFQVPVALENLQARATVPFESLRARSKATNPQTYLVDSSADSTRTTQENYLGWRRASAIRWLHKSAVAHFLQTPDFGVTRMRAPNLHDLEYGDGTPIELPKQVPYEFEPSGVSPARYTAVGIERESKLFPALRDGHSNYQSWFLDKTRFGEIEDLDSVAGFLPHAMVERGSEKQFRDPQDPIELLTEEHNIPDIKLTSLKLVGLLYHDGPVVYELATLPELLNADTAQTRELNAFEERGLQKLLDGDMIYAEANGRKLRMLGALRNATSCYECHGDSPRQLLGAFSYELKSDRTLGAPIDFLGRR